MSASNLSESNAFLNGSDLWIIRNDPYLVWWKKIDLSSKYLLSQNLLNQKKQIIPQLENIIAATNLKLSRNIYKQNHLLLGSEDHFLNKWVLLWSDLDASELIALIEEVAVNLQARSIRFFSDSKIIAELETRLSASSISISYIENT